MEKYERITNSDQDYYEYNGSPADVYRKLVELEDKIENGTLIELPCKIGDTVYYLDCFWIKMGSKDEVVKFTVTGIFLQGPWVTIYVNNNEYRHIKNIHMFAKIDGTFELEEKESNVWFFDKAEAEKKLKEH